MVRPARRRQRWSIENPFVRCQLRGRLMVYDVFTELLLAEVCPACREPTKRGFCATCTADFVRVPNPCSRCALPLPAIHCPRAALGHVARVVAPFAYTVPLAAHVQALKY